MELLLQVVGNALHTVCHCVITQADLVELRGLFGTHNLGSNLHAFLDILSISEGFYASCNDLYHLEASQGSILADGVFLCEEVLLLTKLVLELLGFVLTLLSDEIGVVFVLGFIVPFGAVPLRPGNETNEADDLILVFHKK